MNKLIMKNYGFRVRGGATYKCSFLGYTNESNLTTYYTSCNTEIDYGTHKTF